MRLDLKNLGNNAGAEHPAPAEELAAVAALAAEAPESPAGEPEADAPANVAATPRKAGLNLRKLAAKPPSESVDDEPVSAPSSAPAAASIPEAGTEPSSDGDIASIIKPKPMLSLEEASPTAATQQAPTTPVDDAVPVADAPTGGAAEPKSEDAPTDGAPTDPAAPETAGKTKEELEAEAAAETLNSAWAGLSAVVSSMEHGPERDALRERIVLARRAEAEREAQKAGLGKDEAKSAARGGGGGGLGSLLRGSGASGAAERRRGLVGRVLDARGIGRQATYDSIRGSILRVKGRELAAAPAEIGRRAEELGGKLGEFNSVFLTAAASSRLRKIASDEGKSLDSYLSDLRADPAADRFKPGVEEARKLMAHPDVAKSWAGVETAKERLSRTATKAGDDMKSMVEAFPDRFDGEKEGAKIDGALDAAAAKLPNPVFEDPEKGKLKEMMDGLKERIDEIVKQITQAVASLFGRK